MNLKLFEFKKIIYKLLYYLFTSGLIVALSLLLLEKISKKHNFVNFFAFGSAAFFIINLMQYNVVNKNNPKATKGFLINTILGSILWIILAVSMFYLYTFNFSRNNINIAIILIMILGFLLYYYAFKNNLLNF